MAYQEIPGGLWIPAWKTLGSVALGSTTYVMDATGEYAALICRVPKTGTVEGFEAMIGAVANAVDNGLRFSFQNVDLATGLPDGTPDQSVTTAGGTPAAAGWLNPGNFGATRAVTRGEYLALVIDNPSFTAADSVSVSSWVGVASFNTFPYGVSVVGTKNTQNLPVFALRYNDGTYGCFGADMWAAQSASSWNIDVDTTPDEVGLAFTLVVPKRLSSVMFVGGVAAGANFDIVVYDAASNVLGTTPIDGDVVGATGASLHTHLLDVAVELPIGEYRAVLKPTTTNNITLSYFTFASLALLDTVAGGRTWFGTQRTNAGAWTDFDNVTDGWRRPRMFLQFDAFDDGVGAGGTVIAGTPLMRGMVA